MQGAPRGKGTMGDYRPKARAFMQFCEDQQRQWQPATEATMRLYIAHLMDKGTVLAASLQPYLSAINNYHEDMGHPGPAKGRIVARAVKGMSSMQVQAAKRAGEDQTVRSEGLLGEVQKTKGTDTALANKGLQLALGVLPSRRGALFGAQYIRGRVQQRVPVRALGVLLERVCHLGGGCTTLVSSAEVH
ncbi:hypothetical protein CYMTET_22049 [Cymbomonas tetramitiformis]|uniref:Integrase SAM-like N-terminal domain-containing protein n=1 Tax=Cymbomonas tetramitiformis TaxID=36881 RepID=A0AAE0G241_9CHLO|nr:hypothetical protein CYMTET_22049 [Cymbomonas tetramitiformis]